MKLRHFIPALAAAVLISSVATVSAQPCSHGAKKCQGSGGEHKFRMFADLDLNDKQTEGLKKLHDEEMNNREKHFSAVKEVRAQIKEELLKKEPSSPVLYGYADKLGTLHAQMAKDHGDHLLKVKKILTPEQFSKLVDTQDDMKCGKGFMGKKEGCCPAMKGKCPADSSACPHKGDGMRQGMCPHMQEKPAAE